MFKIKRAGMQDTTDVYGTFSEADAMRKGQVPFQHNNQENMDDEIVVAGPSSVEQEDHSRGPDIRTPLLST